MQQLIDKLKNFILSQKLNSTLLDLDTLKSMTDSDQQLRFAPILRALVVQHFKTSNKMRAKIERRNLKDAPADIRNRAKIIGMNKEWVEDDVLMMLAEALGFSIKLHVIASAVSYDSATRQPRDIQTLAKQMSYDLYESTEVDAPFVNIYFHGNHYSCKPSYHSTIGDGNCLFNAVAQQLVPLLIAALSKPKSIVELPLDLSFILPVVSSVDLMTEADRDLATFLNDYFSQLKTLCSMVSDMILSGIKNESVQAETDAGQLSRIANLFCLLADKHVGELKNQVKTAKSLQAIKLVKDQLVAFLKKFQRLVMEHVEKVSKPSRANSKYNVDSIITALEGISASIAILEKEQFSYDYVFSLMDYIVRCRKAYLSSLMTPSTSKAIVAASTQNANRLLPALQKNETLVLAPPLYEVVRQSEEEALQKRLKALIS